MAHPVPLNDLSRQSGTHQEELTHRVNRVIRSGQYFNGPDTAELSLAISRKLGGHTFLPLANGTDALIVALEALNLRPGSRVAVAPNAGGYGSVAAVRAGLVPTYVDVDASNAQMSPEGLEAVLAGSDDVSAVIVTHLYGQVGDVRSISKLCHDRGVPLIEDCAQSYGAMIDGVSAGTFGDVATFSFYPTKNLGALGDAGGVSSANEQLIERMRAISQYGWSQRYDISIDRGFNSRMDEIQASILVCNLKYIDQWNSRRREIVDRYSHVLPGRRRMIGSNNESFVAHLAVMVTPERRSDRESLAADGIETSIHYPILDTDQLAWSGRNESYGLPSARKMNSEIVTLPCFPLMTEDEISRVCTALSQLGDS